MKFSTMTVAMRLSLSFSLILLFISTITAIGIVGMRHIHQQVIAITDINNAEIRELSLMQSSLYEQSLALRNMALARSPEVLRQQGLLLKNHLQDYQAAESRLSDMFSQLAETTPEEKTAMARISALTRNAVPLLAQLGESAVHEDDTIVNQLLSGALPDLQAQRRQQLEKLAATETRLNHIAKKNAEDAYQLAYTSIPATGLLALIAGIATAFAVTRSLLRQLGGEPAYAMAVAQKIAAGDLTTTVEARDEDIASLLTAMKSMNSSLLGIVRKVRSGTQTMAGATNDIARGNLDLSARTEEQAGALEQTAAAMEELTAIVQKNADHARMANDLAASASSTASEGRNVMDQAVYTMSAIDASSKQIIDIIGVIDRIAFQTNILALNAAVEAARAGEQGRGFAIVAAEVQGLAQRSATAAKEIKDLIHDSVANINSGSMLVSQAGQAIQAVVTSIRNVAAVVNEIAADSREQSTGLKDISRAIVQIDEVTQQNAALVEQAAAAAQSLQEQAQELRKEVDIFIVDDIDERQRHVIDITPSQQVHLSLIKTA